MFCKHCGTENDANAFKCTRCGAVLQSLPAPPPFRSAAIPNHLIWSILATLFCCLPTGIVAIVFAAQVDGKAAAGDTTGARQSSANAATWCWVSFGLGLGFILLYFFGVLATLAGA